MTGDTPDGWILEDDECGHFAIARESDIERYVAIHFMLVHQRTGVIIEGVDFRRLPPVLRCDLCGAVAELPWWEHDADPPIEEDDEYGRWLLCDPCHEHLVRRDALALVERTWTSAKEISPGMINSPAGNLLRQSLMDRMCEAVRSLDDGQRRYL